MLKTASTELTEARAKETVVKQNCEDPLSSRTHLYKTKATFSSVLSDI